MQLPVAVPMNGPPCNDADVTRPDGAKTTRTGIVVLASPGARQARAPRAALAMAMAAAGRLNCLGAATASSKVGPEEAAVAGAMEAAGAIFPGLAATTAGGAPAPVT